MLRKEPYNFSTNGEKYNKIKINFLTEAPNKLKILKNTVLLKKSLL